MRKVLFICFVLILPTSAARAQTAPEILEKVKAVYAGCRSYSDEGSAKARSDGHTRETSFRTSFVRPDAFRFDFWFGSSKRGSTFLFVWKSGQEFKAFSYFGDHNSRFDTSLSRMAQLSAGSSFTVPQLLLPTEFRNAELLSLIAEAKLAGTEKVNGREAFRIEGMLLGQAVMIWIDRSEYLILKTYRKIMMGDQSEEATVEYKPMLNVPVLPEDLTLPPASKKFEGTRVNIPPVAGVSNPPGLAPSLRKFGSSLSLGPNEQVGAAADNSNTDEDVVRVHTELVVCPMLVVDAQGNIVKGLTREDFIVKEDGELQEIATLSMGDNKDLPRSIVLIIDYSGSQLPYINTSIESAKTLVDKLNPKDRMAIVTDDVRLLVDFTHDKQVLKAQLETLKTRARSGNIGASEQYDALLASLKELFNPEDVRPIVIFQTDGDQLESLKGGKDLNPYSLPRKFGLEDILTATEKRRASIYSVISGVKFADLPNGELPKRARLDWDKRQKAQIELMRARNFKVKDEKTAIPPDKFLTEYGTQWLKRQTALMGLAKFTGTVPEFLEDPSQADEIYTRVLNDIDRRYVIGYYPTNRAHDGKRRIVNITVRDHPEYVVWGQKSYFARKEQ